MNLRNCLDALPLEDEMTLNQFNKLLQADLKNNREPRTGKEINREPASMKAMQSPNPMSKKRD